MGRPSSYTPELAAEICERMAKGETLRQICRDDHVPAATTVHGWVKSIEGFSEQYAHAREALIAHWADEIVEIADDGSNDTITDSEGGERQNSEWISRSKLRVDTRKWLLSKLRPDKYGEKLELSGDPTKPLVPIVNVTIGGAKPLSAREAGGSSTKPGE